MRESLMYRRPVYFEVMEWGRRPFLPEPNVQHCVCRARFCAARITEILLLPLPLRVPGAILRFPRSAPLWGPTVEDLAVFRPAWVG